MKNRHNSNYQILLGIGKGMVVFVVGGIVIHTITMIFDYIFVPEPLDFDLRRSFVKSIFSVPMLPMMTAYGTSLLLIYILRIKANRALQIIQQKVIQKEKVELAFRVMQKATGIITELIAANNAEILGWVEYRKSQGHEVSNRVKKPAKNIAKSLQTLSELSFLVPYTDAVPKDIEEIENLLLDRLDKKVN